MSNKGDFHDSYKRDLNAVDKSVPVTFKVKLNAECRYEGKGNKAYEGDLIVEGSDSTLVKSVTFKADPSTYTGNVVTLKDKAPGTGLSSL